VVGYGGAKLDYLWGIVGILKNHTVISNALEHETTGNLVVDQILGLQSDYKTALSLLSSLSMSPKGL
jgi:hypothetical protein